VDVVGIPVTGSRFVSKFESREITMKRSSQVSDATVVLTCIEHYQVKQFADGEGTPDSEVVVHFDLSAEVSQYYSPS